MSEQSEPLIDRPTTFDPISCAGVLLLLMFVLVGATNMWGNNRRNSTEATPTMVIALATNANASTAPDLVAPTLAPTNARDLVAALDTITETPLPTATHTPPPTTIPTHTLTPIPTITPSATPTLTPEPTDTPQPPPPNSTATPIPTATRPLPTPTPGTNEVRVPILMYHYVSQPPADADIYRRDLSVHPDQLRLQLQYLRDNGYTTIDLYDLARALADAETLPEKTVLLTFDDGYRDNYANAFPLLKEFGMTGTFFVLTDLANEWNNDYLTWPMIEEMSAAGMRIEPHTRSHPQLSGRSWEFVVDQLQVSRDEIAAHIGYTPRFLAYPSGRYDMQTIDALYALDFWGAVTTDFGSRQTYDTRYELLRKRMRYTTTLDTFRQMLIVYE